MRSRPAAMLAVGLVVLLSAGLALAGCGSSAAKNQNKAANSPLVSGVHDVGARNLQFIPPAIQVPAGTTVTWHFDDGSVPHNVTGTGFASPKLLKHTIWSHRFSSPGSFTYRCTLHANMVGRVVVVASQP